MAAGGKRQFLDPLIVAQREHLADGWLPLIERARDKNPGGGDTLNNQADDSSGDTRTG